MLPLALFDLKHQGMNYNAFKTFFTDRQTTVNLNPTRSDRFIPIIYTTVTDLVLARQSIAVPLISLAVFLLSLLVFIKSKWRISLKLLFTWLGFALLGLGVYKQHVYIHYLGFIYPAVYLLIGAIIGYLATGKGLILKFLSALIIVFLVYLNIYQSPAFGSPNRQLQRTEAAADLIIKESKGQPFNFGLIAKQNYDESYRYFLENKHSALEPDQNKITDQLFVICEDGDSCQPEGNSQYQIAVFGIAHVENQWQIDYLKIYRLVHTK